MREVHPIHNEGQGTTTKPRAAFLASDEAVRSSGANCHLSRLLLHKETNNYAMTLAVQQLSHTTRCIFDHEDMRYQILPHQRHELSYLDKQNLITRMKS